MEQLPRHKNKGAVMQTYNKTSITQLEVCINTIRYKDIHKSCRFFVVTGGSPELLGMPNIEILSILSVKCSTIEPRSHTWESNEYRTEDGSCINKNSNIDPTAYSKNKYIIDYLMAGLEKEADVKESAVITQYTLQQSLEITGWITNMDSEMFWYWRWHFSWGKWQRQNRPQCTATQITPSMQKT